MLELSSLGDWEPPIVMTVATDQLGADELWQTVGEHRSYLEESGELEARRKLRVQAELTEIVNRSLEQRVITAMEGPETADLKEKLARGEIDPYAAAARLIDLSDG
jgi:LAO/AO transport system kinase